jgi:microcystin-dependent protein
MAQEDYVVSNGTGAVVRADLNNQFKAIVTNNSGAGAPATTYPGMLWLDLSDPEAPDGVLRMRNQANSDWLDYFANAPEFDELRAQVDANTADIADHEQRIVVLEADMVQAQSDIGGNTASIQQNVLDITALDTRMDAVEAKNQTQDNSIGALTTRMGTAETNIGQLQTSTTGNANAITALTTRVTATETKNTAQDTSIGNIETKNTAQDSNIATLDTRVTTLEQGGGGGGGGSGAGVGGHFVGEIFYVPIGTVPAGTVKANGALLSRTTYADLFKFLGTAYGAGDGSTTFGIPDLRGEFIRGWDDGRGVDTGRAIGSAQGSQNLAHTHPVGFPAANGAWTDAGGGAQVSTGPGINMVIGQGTAASSGGPEARPRNVAMMAVIVYKSGAGGLMVAGGTRELGEIFWLTHNQRIPDGCVEADGRAIGRTTYSDYYALVGNTYGAGDGSTTFNVPDMRGMFMRGWDHGRGYDVGRAFGTAQGHAMQATSHSHTLDGRIMVGSITTSGMNTGITPGAAYTNVGEIGDSTWMSGNPGISSPATVGNDTETRPRNLAFLPVVCVQKPAQVVGSGMVQQLIAQGDVLANLDSYGALILNIPDGMDVVELQLSGIQPGTANSALVMWVSTDGTQFWGSDYASTVIGSTVGSPTTTVSNTTASSSLVLGGGQGTAVKHHYSFNIRVSNNLSTTKPKTVQWDASGVSYDNNLWQLRGAGGYYPNNVNLGPFKKVRFAFTDGDATYRPWATGRFQFFGYGRYTVPGAGDVVAGKDMTLAHGPLRTSLALNNEHSAGYVLFSASTTSAPAAVAGMVEVIPANNDDAAPTVAGDWTLQRATTNENPPREFIRRYDATAAAWSAWRQVAFV